MMINHHNHHNHHDITIIVMIFQQFTLRLQVSLTKSLWDLQISIEVNIWEGKGEIYRLRRHYWQYAMLVSGPKMRKTYAYWFHPAKKHMYWTKIRFLRTLSSRRPFSRLMPPLSLNGDWSPICDFWKIAIVDSQRATTSDRRVKHFRQWDGSWWSEVPSPSIQKACVVSVIYQSILVSTSL